MESDQEGDLVQQEAAKRDRRISPELRWQRFQEFCTWLDSQQPIPRNSRAGCAAAAAKREQADRKPTE